jgi:hypothetical protein
MNVQEKLRKFTELAMDQARSEGYTEPILLEAGLYTSRHWDKIYYGQVPFMKIRIYKSYEFPGQMVLLAHPQDKDRALQFIEDLKKAGK